MNSETSARADAGFSMIEVLIAMVILAIGLLAVEALGIGAARSVQRARVQSAYTALATDELERAMVTIASDPVTAIAASSYTVAAGNGAASGARVTRTATFTPVAGTVAAVPGRPATELNLWTVVVRVLPPTSS
ncbi:MAG TPA: prepilin-type N-terminal cleavage/methylation domain-containing protein, partial [Longimicrobium sp.]|nr:prepilin-type N-terminal cleavage/methylation domain-containing protein [Longimicrobium sp.]